MPSGCVCSRFHGGEGATAMQRTQRVHDKFWPLIRQRLKRIKRRVSKLSPGREGGAWGDKRKIREAEEEEKGTTKNGSERQTEGGVQQTGGAWGQRGKMRRRWFMHAAWEVSAWRQCFICCHHTTLEHTPASTSVVLTQSDIHKPLQPEFGMPLGANDRDN